MEKIRVLFVCMGNICRSPTGEGVFKHFVDEQGLNGRFEIDSAGTIGHHVGASADARMASSAARRGYTLLSKARQVNAEDLLSFDLVIAMDRDNLADLETLAGGARENICLLGSYLPGVTNEQTAPSVPDPYYGGDAGFEEVLDMIEAACPNILAHCLKLDTSKG